jgi:hypothetical protein
LSKAEIKPEQIANCSFFGCNLRATLISTDGSPGFAPSTASKRIENESGLARILDRKQIALML